MYPSPKETSTENWKLRTARNEIVIDGNSKQELDNSYLQKDTFVYAACAIFEGGISLRRVAFRIKIIRGGGSIE